MFVLVFFFVKPSVPSLCCSQQPAARFKLQTYTLKKKMKMNKKKKKKKNKTKEDNNNNNNTDPVMGHNGTTKL